MDKYSSIKYLSPEETAVAIRDSKKEGVINSGTLSSYPIEYQNEVRNRFKQTFTDDRSAYHREYMANMKAKELKQDISDDEEERIIKAFGKNKEFQKLRNKALKEQAELKKQEEIELSFKAHLEWKKNIKEDATIVLTFD